MGYVREIGCGQTFSIGCAKKQHQRQPSTVATTTNNLNSQAYREWSPEVQLLHCIRNDNETLKEPAAIHEFIDGFAAAQWLRYQEPNSSIFSLVHRSHSVSWISSVTDGIAKRTLSYPWIPAVGGRTPTIFNEVTLISAREKNIPENSTSKTPSFYCRNRIHFSLS